MIVECPKCETKTEVSSESTGFEQECICGYRFVVEANHVVDVSQEEDSGIPSLPFIKDRKERIHRELNLATEPRAYVHRLCGQATVVDDSVRETYLADPFFYDSGTMCHHCGDAEDKDCTWVETGQNLAEYKRELKLRKGLKVYLFNAGAWILCFVLCFGLAFCLLPFMPEPKKGQPEEFKYIAVVIVGAIAGFALAMVSVRRVRLLLCKRGAL